MLHYSYPFYDTVDTGEHFANLGMGMMTRAIMWARGQGKQYMYLGSAQRSSDVYKFQFDTLEWFDGKKWNTDIKKLKQILATK
jgi:arginyl-tRNA--protein-N-Asp/Glu arginylyltransferase